jgi:hypothetical protein
MNDNLLKVLNQITAQYGEDALADSKRLKAFFADLAKDEPKPLCLAFCRAVEEGAYNALKTAPEAEERASRKTSIAQRVRDAHGIDPILSIEALDILDAALFGEENVAQTQAPPAPANAPPVAGRSIPPAQMKLYLQYLAAVKKDGSRLENVPEELMTAEICLAAVRDWGKAVQYVTEELMTAEICLAAVKQNGNALEVVPEEYKTAEVCLAAVQQNGKVLMHKYIPAAQRTAELCLEAVKNDAWALTFVPEKLKTAEMCLAAVQQDGMRLCNVPEKLKTAEICLAAVQQKSNALTFVPSALEAQVKAAAGL